MCLLFSASNFQSCAKKTSQYFDMSICLIFIFQILSSHLWLFLLQTAIIYFFLDFTVLFIISMFSFSIFSRSTCLFLLSIASTNCLSYVAEVEATKINPDRSPNFFFFGCFPAQAKEIRWESLFCKPFFSHIFQYYANEKSYVVFFFFYETFYFSIYKEDKISWIVLNKLYGFCSYLQQQQHYVLNGQWTFLADYYIIFLK